jgi:hypothetical protein
MSVKMKKISKYTFIGLAIIALITVIMFSYDLYGVSKETYWFLFEFSELDPRNLPEVKPIDVWLASKGMMYSCVVISNLVMFIVAIKEIKNFNKDALPNSDSAVAKPE